MKRSKIGRNFAIQIRLTADERRRIMRAAKEAGVETSVWVRATCLGALEGAPV